MKPLDLAGGPRSLLRMADSDPSLPDTVPTSLPRVALVTGAARRIGRAIALDLARQGWDVAVHANNSRDEADALVREITAFGRRATVLSADLMNEDEVETLVPSAAAALGPVGLLVNNASIFEQDDIEIMDRAGWDRHMEANLRAPALLIQRFATALPPEAEGVVVNIIDQRVLHPGPDFLSYTLSKSGLWTLTRTLALALAPRIRVNAIGPGPVLQSIHQSQADFAAEVESVPLRRQTELAEICRAIAFIVQARSMTGQMIALDGGQHLS
ncbi:NAD(P)-dependent dehydrogenase (short-subunit alcohol dehydrogenase family) [Oceanibaculum indicum]|uniref:NAD(P)-dependent dehydrogenase (Short-subunit alcohol dehydrogenase family) n=2 Tax=Oceanibaculaceae TaxID=3031147 RepID=A0A420WRP9_9PROT|nr:NAD(P)-dependent dehydrogenase (short-subunit alcohol dehydrogenase family) [Oceanibaculum indicum]